MHAQPLFGVNEAVEAALRLADASGLAWLDGGAHGPEGRWSFVGAEPVARVRVGADAPFPCRALDLPVDVESASPWPGAPAPSEVPRWIGWIAYDAARPVHPDRPFASLNADVVSFARYDALAAFDHATGVCCIVGDDPSACARLAARLGACTADAPRGRVHGVVTPDPAVHRAAIQAALQHIARGDVYQVNLARCWRAGIEGHPLALFLAMRAASPVPLGCYFDDGRCQVLARSMERFLRWERRRCELVTRPIKGTIGREGSRDAIEGAELRADPKERAEHAMIVDLMRNDLGRVASLGTVEVVDLMRVEAYAGLHHLVSTIRCRTAPGTTPGAILEATFPPGSVTGTPKVRAMEIIDALEPCARGVYTGALGFVDREGGLSLAVAIRTAVVSRGEVEYWAGGGIVEASQLEREVAETELKARVFLDAVRSLAQAPGDSLSRSAILR